MTSLLLSGALLACALSVVAQSTGRQSTKRPAPANPKPQVSADFDQAVKTADEARAAGRLDDALALYGKALQMRPNWPEGWWYAGTILYDKDRYPEARDAFRNLVALDPQRAFGWAMLGLCEYETREYDRAVISLQRSRSMGLSTNREIESVARYRAALLYIRFEQFEYAYEILSEFVREGYENPKVVEAFGLAMLRLPFLPNEIPPDKREQVLIAGQAGYNMAAHRRDETKQAFSQLLAKYPETPNVHYAYGVYLLKQDADAALQEFQHELKSSPSHVPSMLQMAFEYFKRNEFETALPLAEKSVQLAPKMYAGRNVLGRVLLELGQTDRAIAELEAGIRLAPESPEMHYALARAFTRAGRKEDAARERATFQQLQKAFNARRQGAPAEAAEDNLGNIPPGPSGPSGLSGPPGPSGPARPRP
jgi:predicted Zn-dependent protease